MIRLLDILGWSVWSRPNLVVVEVNRDVFYAAIIDFDLTIVT